jgi:hypothetical protein
MRPHLPLPTRPRRHCSSYRTHTSNPSKKKGMKRKESLEQEIKGGEDATYLPRFTPDGLALVRSMRRRASMWWRSRGGTSFRAREGISDWEGDLHDLPARGSGAGEWRRMGLTALLAPSGVACLWSAASMACSRKVSLCGGGEWGRTESWSTEVVQVEP